ncbi:MAG: hypothetical protein QXX08_07325 [Candidatus Bathyarchaeia archaeon]
MKKLKILAAFLILFFGLSCSLSEYYLLEKRLHPSIAGWFEVHHFIMDYRLPKELAKEFSIKSISEDKLFLMLPFDKQLEYTKDFWSFHGEEPLAKEYYERVKIAYAYTVGENRYNPLRTDRAWILIVCGIPYDVTIYVAEKVEIEPFSEPHIRGIPYTGSSYEDEVSSGKTLVEVWTYFWGHSVRKNNVTRFYFFLNQARRWELSKESMNGNTYDFIKYSKKQFEPDDDNWRIIISKYYKYINK